MLFSYNSPVQSMYSCYYCYSGITQIDKKNAKSIRNRDKNQEFKKKENEQKSCQKECLPKF